MNDFNQIGDLRLQPSVEKGAFEGGVCGLGVEAILKRRVLASFSCTGRPVSCYLCIEEAKMRDWTSFFWCFCVMAASACDDAAPSGEDGGESLSDASVSDSGDASVDGSSADADDASADGALSEPDADDATTDSDLPDSDADADAVADGSSDAGESDASLDGSSDFDADDATTDSDLPDCGIYSSNPCYTACSEEKDAFFAWLNGTLVYQKCRDRSCVVSAQTLGAVPDACDPYDVPPESCDPQTSASLCSPDGREVWTCSDDRYIREPCDPETERCVQCQNLAGCLPNENCTEDSTRACNAVCNEEGDGFYLWDANAERVLLHVCPQGDCIHRCGMAECRSGTGYHAGETCDASFKYCTRDGAMAFTCEAGLVVQTACANGDCRYDAAQNEITSCTAESL